MKTTNELGRTLNSNAHSPHRVRLPGFIADEEIGLGDMIKRATSYFKVRSCGGCERRAASLNRWTVFTGRRG
jgi:hypothetical protein